MNATDTPESLFRLASHLLQKGQVREAIDVHERVLAIRPGFADSWFNLGYLQRQLGRFEAALTSYAQALECGVTRPEEAHLNRAAILSEQLRRSEAAEHELKAALAFNPRFLPALLNLGNIYEERGDGKAARTAYERILALDDTNALALARLVELRSPADPDDPLIRQIRTALDRSGIGSDEAADLGFALGKALDSVGSYSEAFAAYSAANRASRASSKMNSPLYDAELQRTFIDRIINAFQEPVGRAPKAAQSPPIFICGMFRSGSTLVEQILASHPRVTAAGELHFLPAIVQKALQPYPEAAAAAGPAKLNQIRKAYLESLRKLHPHAEIVTDKRPDNFLLIGLIKALFPDAKIIHTKRNPLDNCLSIYFLHLHPSMAYALDLSHTAHWYGLYRQLMAHWKALYPEDIHDVDYDMLVTSPRPVIKELLDFCDLNWAESCMSFHAGDSIQRTASAWQVRQPLYRRSSGRWRNYEAQLEPIRSALDAMVDSNSG